MTGTGTTLVPEIARLKAEQTALRAQRKRLAKDLKNAEKKRSRLKKRAKLLTDSDLVAVMMLRVAERKDVKPFAGPTGESREPTAARDTEQRVVVDDTAEAAVSPEEPVSETPD